MSAKRDRCNPAAIPGRPKGRRRTSTGTGSQVVQHPSPLMSSRCSLISFELDLGHGNKVLPTSAVFGEPPPGLLTRPRRVSLFFEERV